ncbi:hypothetical protein L3Q82_013042, partial [Scortum barcoo]
TSSEYPIEPNEGYILLLPPELKSCLCGNGLIAGRLCPEGEPTLQEERQSRFLAVTAEVGKGNVAVVSPPGAYDNMAYPGVEVADRDNQRYDEAPPDYAAAMQDSDFSDALIRRGFIRKVYLTLMIQLLVTVGIICAFLYWDTLRTWVLHNYWFSYTMIGVVLVLIVALSCCDNLRRRVPLNFIALGLFVNCGRGPDAWIAGSWDFTGVNGSLWVFAWTLISFACLCAILRSEFLYIFYACLATLLFSLYLVFDTQLILGGKHKKYEISPE